MNAIKHLPEKEIALWRKMCGEPIRLRHESPQLSQKTHEVCKNVIPAEMQQAQTETTPAELEQKNKGQFFGEGSAGTPGKDEGRATTESRRIT